MVIKDNDPKLSNGKQENNATSMIDEFDVLMARMRHSLHDLEDRVNTRTRDLEIAAEVSRQVSTNLNLDNLLPQMVELTKNQFDLYHAHVYLLEDDILVLAAGSGEAGRQMLEAGHQIPFDHPSSIVARCAQQRQGIITNDVLDDPDFLPNQLLPETRSELAVPLLVGDELIGVLDVQSTELNRFDEDDRRMKFTLASQLGVAVQNARAFEQIEEARDEIRRVYETSVDMIGTANPEGYFLSLNPAWRDTLGWSLEELMSKPYIEFVHPDDREKTINEAQTNIEHGVFKFQFMNRYESSDGSYRWLSWNATFDEEVEEFYFVARDMTEQQEFDERLREANKRFEDIQHAIDEHSIVAMTDVTGKITYANDKFCEISGFDREELIGQDHRIINSGHHAKEFIRDLWVTIANGNTWHGEILNQAKDGRPYWVDTTIVPLLNAKGKPSQYIAIRTDITERKSRELRAQLAYELGDTLATVLDPQKLLALAVNRVAETFDYYHTHIYLIEGDDLYVAEGLGQAGEEMKQAGHSIPRDAEKSLVARAARSGEPVIVQDVTDDPEHLPNPLLYQTRSEVAVPLVLGSEVIGVLDVQHTIPDHFNYDEVQTLEIVTNQLAIAISNARQLDETQRSRELAEKIGHVREGLTRATNDQEILEAINGYTTEAEATLILSYLDPDEEGRIDLLTSVGALVQNQYTPLKDTQRASQNPISQLYLDEPYNNIYLEDVEDADFMGEEQIEALKALNIFGMVIMPLYAANQWQGVLTISWAEPHHFTEEEIEVYDALRSSVASVVASRRAYLDAQAALTVSNRRALELEAVAQVSADATGTLDVETLLSGLVELVKSRFEIYHAQVYLLNDVGDTLDIVAGAGEAGRLMVERGHPIKLSASQSMIARAARDRKPQVAADIADNEDFLPNPLLPDTHSELTIPMDVAGRLIGVLDVQSNEVGRFGPDDARIMGTLASQVAVAVENARSFSRTESALQQTAMFSDTSEAMINAETYDEILQAFAAPLLDQDQDGGFAVLQIVYNDEDGQPITAHIAAQTDAGDLPTLPVGTDLDLRQFPTSKLIYDDPTRFFIIEDAGDYPFEDEGLRGLFEQVGMMSTFNVPLSNPEGEWIGSVGFNWPEPRHFGDDEMLLYNTLGPQLSTIIQNRRLLEQTEHSRARAELLATTTSALTQATTEQEILAALTPVTTAQGMTLATLSYIPYDRETPDVLEVLAAQSGEGEPLPLSMFPATYVPFEHYPLAYLIFETPDEVMVIENAFEDERTEGGEFREFMRQIDVSAAIFIPLKSGTRVHGLVSFTWAEPRQFDHLLIELTRALRAPLTAAVGTRQAYVQQQAAREIAEKRAVEMETVADVSTEATASMDVSSLLQNVSDLVKERFNLYHAHVYLLDENGETLSLAAGADKVGRELVKQGHSIPIDREHSLVARAARSMEGVISNDVREEPDFFQNPMLPDTRSELAIPMIVNERLVGVLDIQSTELNRFTVTDVRIQNTLAAQLVVAVQNARSFEETKKRAAEIQTVAEIGAEIALNQNVADLLWKIANLTAENFQRYYAHIYLYEPSENALVLRAGSGEIGRQLVAESHNIPLDREDSIVARAARSRQVQVIGDVTQEPAFYPNPLLPDTASELAIPILIGTELIGVLDVQEDEKNAFSSAEVQAKTVLANQVAVAIQNARAFEDQTIQLEISGKLTDATSPQELLSAIVGYAAPRGLNAANLFYITNDEEGETEFAEVVARWPNVAGSPATPMGAKFVLADYRFTDLWLSNPNAPVLIPNMQSSPLVDEATHQVYADLNIKGSVLIPLYSRDEWIGVFILNWDEHHNFTQQDQRIYKAIMGQATSAAAALRSTAETQSRATAIETVAEIGAQIALNQNVDTLLRTVANLTKENFNRYHAHIYIYDPRKDLLTLRAGAGEVGQQLVERGHSIELDKEDSLVAQAARTRQPVVIDDVSNDPNYLPNDLLQATKSELAMPIILGDELIGVLDVQDDKTYAFSPAEVQVKGVLANQIAVAFQNARAFEAAEARATEIETVAAIGAQIVLNQNVDDLLWNVANLTKENFDRYHAHIYIYDPRNKRLNLRAGAGQVGEKMVRAGHAISLGLNSSVVARAARERQAVLVDNTRTAEGFLPNPLLPDTHSELAVPITLGSELIGVLDVQDDQPYAFNADEAQTKTVLANQIAAAIQNARSFEATQRRLHDVRLSNTISELARLTDDMETTLQSMLLAILENFGADTGVYSEFSRGDQTWYGRAGAGTDMNNAIAQTIIDPAEAYPHGIEAMQVGDVVAVSDVQDYPDFPLQYTEEDNLAIKSVMVLPVSVGQEAKGVIFINWAANVHEISDEEIRRARGIANQISVTIERQQAEDDLQEREEYYRSLIENTNDVITILGADGTVMYGSPSIKRVLGYDPEAVVGGSALQYVHPDDIERVGENIAIAQELEGREPAPPIQFRWKHKDGSWRWLEAINTSLLNNPAIGGMVVNSRDVTEQKAAEEQRELYANVMTNTPVGIHVWQLEDHNDETTLRMTAANKSSEAATGLAPASIIGKRMSEAFPELMSTPIPKIYADIAVTGNTVDLGEVEYGDDNVEPSTFFVRAFGLPDRSVGVSFENITDRKKAQEEIERLASIINTSEDYMAIASLDTFELIYLNDGGLAMFGYTEDEVMGKEVSIFTTEETFDRIMNEALPVVTTGQNWRGEMIMRHKDGHTFPVEQTIFIINDVDGKPLGIATIMIDISERKQAQNEIEFSRHRAEMLALINSALSQATDEQQLLDAVLPLAQEQGADIISLTYADDDEMQMTEIVAASDGQGQRLPLSIFPVTKLGVEEFPVLKLIHAAPDEILAIGNYDTDPRTDDNLRAFLENANLKATISIPLRTGRKWEGALSLSWSTPQNFDEGTIEVAERIQSSLSSAVASRRAYLDQQEARREAEALYKISESINAANTPQEMSEAIFKDSGFDPFAMTIVAYEGFDLDTATYFETVALSAQEPDKLVQKAGDRFSLELFPGAYDLAKAGMIVIEDMDELAETDATTAKSLRSLGYEAYIAVNIGIGNRVMGTVSIFSDKPHRYNEVDRRIAQNIADLLAAALDRYSLNRQTERRAAELQTVASVSAATTTLLDVDELLRNVSNMTKEAFDLYHAHIYLLDEEKQNLVLAAGAGEPGLKMIESGHGISMRQEASIVATAAKTGEGVIANDVTSNPTFLPNPLLPDTKSEMAIPMIVRGEVIGVLDVQSDEVNHFDQNDVQVKTVLAEQIAIAVENARSYEEIELQAARERQTAERLREVDRLKSQFLANMSHELRTPLNSIIGYSEVLLDGVDGELNDDMEEDIDAIHNSGKHLLSIINEILDLAKIEAGQMQLDTREVDLIEFSNEIIRSGQVLVKDKPVELKLVVDGDIPSVAADPVRLRQILWNLTSNALKFTEEGIVQVKLSMFNKKTALITVKDNGIGMSEEGLDLIFQRFSQVDGSSTRRAGGTGLGLTITKQLIEMHGGEIDVESQEGVGSTFWFTIPIYEGETE